MKTIRAIFENGHLRPLEPIDLPENVPLTVALLDSDDLSSGAIAELADKTGVFDFLSDPREDIYSDSDGQAV